MNKNWEVKRLGEVCEFEKLQGIHKNLPYVGLEDIESHTGRFLGSQEPQQVKSATFRFTSEHILYGRLRPYLNKVIAPDFSGHCSAEIFPIKPNSSLSKSFLLYWFLMDSTVARINATCTGTRMPRANMNTVLDFDFSSPSLPEQQQIVSILGETFALIDKTKENAEKNLKNAREIFESILHLIFTEKGEGWEEKTVEEIVNEGVLFKPQDGNHGELHPKKSDYAETGVPFIMAADLKNGSVDFTECKFIPRNMADSLRTGFARDGDVLLSHKATIGRAAILRTDNDYVMLTPQVTYYRVKDENRLFNKFIYFYFLSPQFQHEILDCAGGGSTRAYIGITKQLKLSFLLPPLSEQYSIVARLDALSAETKRLEEIYQKKLAVLDELKKSVLQKAFNGELIEA